MAGRSDDAIARARMVGQGVWSSPPSAPDAAVRRLVAMQAQEHRYARWSVGQRSAHARAPMSTLRSTPAPSCAPTCSDRPGTSRLPTTSGGCWRSPVRSSTSRNARRDEELELDARTIRRATDVIADAVTAGPLTRRELAQVLERRRIATGGQRIAHLLYHAELRAAVCSGPMRGKVHTYAAFDGRVPPGIAHEGAGALAELATRWFTTRGPATLRDFAWWSGLPMADARAGLAAAAAESGLTSFERHDRTYWFGDVGKRVKGHASISCSATTRRSSRTRSRATSCRPPASRSPPAQHRRVRARGAVRRTAPRALAGGPVAGGDAVETRIARTLDDREEAALEAAVARYEEFERT